MKLFAALLMLCALSPACFAGAPVGVGSMIIGNKALEVTERRQMTLRADGRVISASVSPDGRYVAYFINSKDEVGSLRLARISTGRTATIMAASWSEDDPTDVGSDENVEWVAHAGSVLWAPDGSQFAIMATHYGPEDDSEPEDYVLIYSASGVLRRTLTAPDGISTYPKPLFTPDGHKLVLVRWVLHNPDSEDLKERTRTIVDLLDVGTGARCTIYSPDTNDVQLLGWSKDGSLLCTVSSKEQGGGSERHKIGLDGKSDEVVARNSAMASACSPDGMYASGSNGTVHLWNLTTDKRTVLAKDSDGLDWAPVGHMLFFLKYEHVEDTSTTDRTGEYYSLWLANAEPGKLDRMCIALDVGPRILSCSRDLGAVAYTSKQQLYVAELALREPTPEEKLICGLPYSEEQMKEALERNARKIAISIVSYTSDHDEALPSAESISSVVTSLYTDDSCLYRPGTKELALRYMGASFGNLANIKDLSETVIGEMDGGYGWRIRIYADGHTDTYPPEE